MAFLRQYSPCVPGRSLPDRALPGRALPGRNLALPGRPPALPGRRPEPGRPLPDPGRCCARRPMLSVRPARTEEAGLATLEPECRLLLGRTPSITLPVVGRNASA